MAKKKKTVTLDLSISQAAQRMSEFEVQDYDYELRQSTKAPGFEEDLDFLLSERDEVSEDSDASKNCKKSGKDTPKLHSSLSPKPADPNQVNRANSARFSELSAQFSNLNIAGKNSKNAAHGRKNTESKKGRSAKEVQRITRKEITGDLDGIEFSSDEETENAHDDSKENLPTTTFEDLELLEQEKAPKRRSRSRKKKNKDNGVNVANMERISLDEPQSTIPGEKDGSENVPQPSNNSPKMKSRARKISPETTENTSPESTDELKTAKSSAVSSSVTGETATFPRLSSAKATQIKQLPVVQPVSTIFGLSHEQIYKTKLTDVKVKTIVNVPMSKMCKNALTFVMAENEGLFLDEVKKAQFVDLCTKVALYEAPGFNEVTKRIPELLEWVPQYDPLTLQHTKTNVTASNKQIHKNCLDYTVFSFFGHILLWANELQHTAKVPTITEKYDLGVSRSQIFNSLGGYHLWDRLRRSPQINTKRWKHIQKFRQIFAFEEHQFVLILRCMNLGVPVC